MPEGDTIFRTAEKLRGALQGKRILAAKPERLKRLTGTTVTEVKPVGKHLLIRFDNGLALHTHMRMRGVWQVYPRGKGSMRPAWQLRPQLANMRGTMARRFPGYGKGAVHGRAPTPCPRCGTLIKVRAQGEHARLAYWCPRCQI